MNNKRWLWMIILHIALFIYSCSGIFSKSASRSDFLSLRFCLFYGGMLFIMVVYAVMWQQILKHIPLTTAYANKAISIVWGMIIGAVLFQESFTWRQIIAAVIIIAGVIFYVIADAEETEHDA